MSTYKTNPLSRLALALTITSGWLCGSLDAAEAAPSTSPPSTPAQSIESTKKEFDALKAAREAAQRGQGSATLPLMTVPELQAGLGGGDPRPAQGTKAKPAIDPAKKSANWLVDGIAREASRRDAERGRSANSGIRDGGVDGAVSDGTDLAIEAVSPTAPRSVAPSSRDSRDTAASEKEKSSEAPNPLKRYLPEWMTPRDYATLKPSLTDGLAADSASRGLNDITLPASMGGGLSGINLPGGLTPPGTEFLSAGPKAPIAPPRENPYLQSFALPPAPLTSLPAPPPPPAPGPAVSPMPSTAPATPAAKPAVPDFARPAQDEKYFKQLKRF